jgi:hypothetical protein
MVQPRRSSGSSLPSSLATQPSKIKESKPRKPLFAPLTGITTILLLPAPLPIA